MMISIEEMFNEAIAEKFTRDLRELSLNMLIISGRASKNIVDSLSNHSDPNEVMRKFSIVLFYKTIHEKLDEILTDIDENGLDGRFNEVVSKATTHLDAILEFYKVMSDEDKKWLLECEEKETERVRHLFDDLEEEES